VSQEEEEEEEEEAERRRGGTNPLAPESSKRSDRIDWRGKKKKKKTPTGGQGGFLVYRASAIR
jgi:hypothetical protein